MEGATTTTPLQFRLFEWPASIAGLTAYALRPGKLRSMELLPFSPALSRHSTIVCSRGSGKVFSTSEEH